MLNSPHSPSDSPSESSSKNLQPASVVSTKGHLFRGAMGGVLMGLANLVPGISGGTMLLVSGVYHHFIDGLSDLTRFRFRYQSILLLLTIVVGALLSVLIFAGLLREAILDHRWVMYSLFIGLTLGGLPLLCRMASPIDRQVITFAITSFLILAVLLLLKLLGYAGTPQPSLTWSLLAGVGGASAMILPGISGAYLLILMGQYETLLQAIQQFKEGLKSANWELVLESFQTLIPVGIGVILGVLLISNLLRWLLSRYKKQTLGFLIGLLLGSVCGLYPFQEAVRPAYGTLIRQKMVTMETIHEFSKKDWPVVSRFPSGTEGIMAIVLVGLGFAVTIGISKIGSKLESTK